jgi:hypothetical protein
MPAMISKKVLGKKGPFPGHIGAGKAQKAAQALAVF